MKYLILFSSFVLFIISAEAQVKTIIAPKILEGTYVDGYGTFNHYYIFHDQSLINFYTSEGESLSSFLSNTSPSIHDKYVLGSQFSQNIANHFHSADTSQTWVDIVFKLSFKYNNDEFSIVKYQIVNNGFVTKPNFDRLLHKIDDGKYLYLIDRRNNDLFLSTLTRVLGSMKKPIIRILLGIDPPKSKEEIEFTKKVTSADNSLHVSTLVDMFNNGDRQLRQFLDM